MSSLKRYIYKTKLVKNREINKKQYIKKTLKIENRYKI